MKIIYDQGLYLPELDLWMDSRRPRERSVISHAHSDHIENHGRIIATPATARLFKHRIGETEADILDFDQPLDLDGFRLTFKPAGHILGSAQTLVEHAGERLVYTGDFKLRAGLSCELGQIVPCDTLVIECTFGRPAFRFPPEADVHRLLCQQLDEAFQEGLQPVVYGYSLGKGQEALQILLSSGYSVAVHPSILEIVDIYRELGMEFSGDYRPLDYSDTDGLVMLLPPGAARSLALQEIENKFTIYLTGWAMDPRMKYRYRASSVLPLSDHAGFDDLERYVRQSGARKIYTVHGDDHFASYLRGLGFDAEHLEAAAPEKPRSKARKAGDSSPTLFDFYNIDAAEKPTI